jgi:hypothetical protein
MRAMIAPSCPTTKLRVATPAAESAHMRGGAPRPYSHSIVAGGFDEMS